MWRSNVLIQGHNQYNGGVLPDNATWKSFLLSLLVFLEFAIFVLFRRKRIAWIEYLSLPRNQCNRLLKFLVYLFCDRPLLCQHKSDSVFGQSFSHILGMDALLLSFLDFVRLLYHGLAELSTSLLADMGLTPQLVDG